MPKKTEAKKEEAKIKTPKEKKPVKLSFYQAVGRRKVATARVKLYVVPNKEIQINGKTLKVGEMVVNDRPIDKYFPGAVYQKLYEEPFRTTNSLDRFAVTAVISGGGLVGQLGAFIHGVSRAIESIDKEKYRVLLKRKGFLRRDDREKERRKAGFAQKARARKQSPKR